MDKTALYTKKEFRQFVELIAEMLSLSMPYKKIFNIHSLHPYNNYYEMVINDPTDYGLDNINIEMMESCGYITLDVKMLCWSIESHKTVYRVPSKDFSVTSAYKALIDFGYNELVKKLIEIKKLKQQLSDSKDEFWKIHKKLERKLKK